MEEDVTNKNEEPLYLHNAGRKSFQWELWKYCNNLCSFCYLGKESRGVNKERQLKSLTDLNQALDCLDFNEYNNISLIGGEFFQGQLNDPEVKNSFMAIIEKISNYYLEKKIGSIWISATLTIGNQKDLYEALDIFQNAGVKPNPKYGSSGVWICTSWDAEGRFRNDTSRLNWEYHMKNIAEKYPWVKKNTTIILMQKFCEEYISGNFVPEKFMKEFSTSLFYKSPGITEPMFYGDKEYKGMLNSEKKGKIDEYFTFTKEKMAELAGFDFFPDRTTFRKFLIEYAKKDPQTYDRLFNIDYRADELYMNFNEKDKAEKQERNKNTTEETLASIDSVENPNCLLQDQKKHNAFYAGYSDCNACMICDRTQIWDSLYSMH